MPETRDAAAANRMYWESDDSVADIAARFDFSRRALYDAVSPWPAGTECTSCGADLVFENRLARKNGLATCPVCGATRDGVEPPASTARPLTSDSRPAVAREDARGGEIRQRAVLLSGAAIAGIAIGGVATWLARRRD